MKINVDLTENGDFQKSLHMPKNFRQMLGLCKKINTRMFDSDMKDGYLSDKGLVYQGNGYQRKTKKLINSFNNGIECDKCGCLVKPYTHDTLCETCRKGLWYRAYLENIFWLEVK